MNGTSTNASRNSVFCAVIDLTDVDTSDEEEDGEVERNKTTGSMRAVTKFTFRKVTRFSSYDLVREGMAEKIYYSLFSNASKMHFAEMVRNEKRTYIGESTNPYVGNGLFAAEVVEAGEMVCIYYGIRMPWCEAEARMNAGGNPEYMLYITDGSVIDGAGVLHGAAMANHSCTPNSELRHTHLRGYDRAPIGIMKALQRINIGDELYTTYGYFDPSMDPIPDMADTAAYVPCKCLRPNCCGVLRKK